MKPAKAKETAETMMARLRERFAGCGGYITLEQVRNAAGFQSDSTIDAVVISTWPSNGLWRDAFEIKVERSDFLREVANPKKNQWARERFHHFWFVTPPGLAQPEELPDGCGLMVSHGKTLKVVRQAALVPKPEFDDSLLASIVKSACKADAKCEDDLYSKRRAADKEYLEAVAWRSAARKFIAEHGGCDAVRWYENDESNIVAALNAVVSGTEKHVEMQKARDILAEFQSGIARLIMPFLVLSQITLDETDKADEKILRWLGADGAETLAVERIRTTGKKNHFRFGEIERQMLQMIAEWAKVGRAEEK